MFFYAFGIVGEKREMRGYQRKYTTVFRMLA